MDVNATWDRIAATIQNVMEAGWVQITRYDAERDEAVVVGASPFQIPTLNRLCIMTDALIAPLNPFHRGHQAWANFYTRQVYLEGLVTRTTIDNYLHGILAPELVAVLAQYETLHTVHILPLKNSREEVAGALIAYGGPETLFTRLDQFEDLVWLYREVLQASYPAPMLHTLQQASWNWHIHMAERLTEHAEILDTVIQSRLSAGTWRLSEILNQHDLPSALQTAIREVRDILSNLAADEVYSLSQALYPSLLRIGLLPGISALINDNAFRDRIALSIDEEIKAWDHPLHNHIPWSIRLAAWTIVRCQLETLTQAVQPESIRIHIAVGSKRLWIQIQGDPHGAISKISQRAAIDEYALLLAGTTFWSDQGSSLMAILPLTFEAAFAVPTPIFPEP